MKLLMLILACTMLSSCSQRICEYNPTTGSWRYKSNSFATDSRADRILVKTEAGAVVEVDNVVQDNDSLTFRINPITKQIEVVTKGK